MLVKYDNKSFFLPIFNPKESQWIADIGNQQIEKCLTYDDALKATYKAFDVEYLLKDKAC